MADFAGLSERKKLRFLKKHPEFVQTLAEISLAQHPRVVRELIRRAPRDPVIAQDFARSARRRRMS
jgi:hypothetical protein